MKTSFREKGVALIIAMILIIPLTLIAVAVMQWTREDLKMIGAIADRNSAEQVLIGVMQEVMVVNNLSSVLSTMSTSSSVTTVSNNAIPLTLRAEVTCKRKFNATSDSVIKTCRYVDANSNINFSKSNIGGLQMTLDIEQPLLSNSGG